jgi:peptide subunit release factor 1 (eRF1)
MFADRLVIKCARCGEEMLAQASRTAENNEMEVCSRCEWQMRCEDVQKLTDEITDRANVEADLRAQLAEAKAGRP